MGNYGTGERINTGSNENYKTKNIYDLAGNVYEWTLQAFNFDARTLRGGNCTSIASSFPASGRVGKNPTEVSNLYGSRIQLFIEVGD